MGGARLERATSWLYGAPPGLRRVAPICRCASWSCECFHDPVHATEIAISGPAPAERRQTRGGLPVGAAPAMTGRGFGAAHVGGCEEVRFGGGALCSGLVPATARCVTAWTGCGLPWAKRKAVDGLGGWSAPHPGCLS